MRHDSGMSEAPENWTARHFSQANPAGRGQGDVAALLRRVADTLERLGSLEVHDLVKHNGATPEGDWPSLIVYFTSDDAEGGSAERRA